jgi:hypothetical protein
MNYGEKILYIHLQSIDCPRKKTPKHEQRFSFREPPSGHAANECAIQENPDGERTMRKRNAREYGLTSADRKHEVERRFGVGQYTRVREILAGVAKPTEQILGAIVFLARSVDELPELVDLANEDPQGLLNAATVKEERG